MDNESKKTTTVSSYAIIAIVAALALPGIVEITVGTIQQQQQEAEAKGCRTSIAFNASQGTMLQAPVAEKNTHRDIQKHKQQPTSLFFLACFFLSLLLLRHQDSSCFFTSRIGVVVVVVVLLLAVVAVVSLSSHLFLCRF